LTSAFSSGEEHIQQQHLDQSKVLTALLKAFTTQKYKNLDILCHKALKQINEFLETSSETFKSMNTRKMLLQELAKEKDVTLFKECLAVSIQTKHQAKIYPNIAR
jgi:hypothetical protein